jgi:hypothetical protein
MDERAELTALLAEEGHRGVGVGVRPTVDLWIDRY